MCCRAPPLSRCTMGINLKPQQKKENTLRGEVKLCSLTRKLNCVIATWREKQEKQPKKGASRHAIIDATPFCQERYNTTCESEHACCSAGWREATVEGKAFTESLIHSHAPVFGSLYLPRTYFSFKSHFNAPHREPGSRR